MINVKRYDCSKNLVDQIFRVSHENAYRIPRFSPLRVGNNFLLSIQASKDNYCSPRDDFENASDYQNFEIAILIFKNGDWEICQPRDFAPEERFSWSELFDEGESAVAGWVDPSKIEEIVKDLIKIDQLIVFN